MKVLNRTPLTLAEVKSKISDFEDKPELEAYLKKFSKLDEPSALKLKEDILALNNAKINLSDIVKVCDLLPSNSEEVNKIFNDVSLSEEEVNKILEIVKKHNGS